MANVLPIEEKKRVMRSLRSRFVLAAAIVILAGALIASAALAPTLIYIRLATGSIQTDGQLSETAREDQAKQARALALVTALSPIANATSSPSSALVAALAAKPAGISITSMNYSKGKILLSGISKDRQAVNAYRESLEADTHFSAVSVPVAALVGAQDGRFTITLSGAF